MHPVRPRVVVIGALALIYLLALNRVSWGQQDARGAKKSDPVGAPRTSAASANRIDGTIKKVENRTVTVQRLPTDAPQVVTVPEKAHIRVNNRVSNVADLMPGMLVTILFQGNGTTEIVAFNSPRTETTNPPVAKRKSINGTVTAITKEKITIQNDVKKSNVVIRSTSETLSITASTQITLNGERATIADIKAGMLGGVTYATEDKTALSIYVVKVAK